MTRFLSTLTLGLALAAGSASSATITSLNDTSVVIGAPVAVNDDTPGDNQTVFAFREAAGVLLTEDLATRDGIIAAGTLVDSHMIFFNRSDSERIVARANYGFEFSKDILGVLTSHAAVRGSNDLLGAAGTTYGRLNGFEGSDSGILTANSISGRLIVSQPGDWFRVVTVAAVPLPATGALLMTTLLGAGLLARRRKD